MCNDKGQDYDSGKTTGEVVVERLSRNGRDGVRKTFAKVRDVAVR